MSFCTAINCMDGRVQSQVTDYLRNHFEVEVLIRQERDTRADGVFDSITYFETGQRSRQELDTRGDGRIHTRNVFEPNLLRNVILSALTAIYMYCKH